MHNRVPVCLRCLEAPKPFSAEVFCPRCRMAFSEAEHLGEGGECELCASGVTQFAAAYSYGFYEDELRGLILLLKYGGIRTLAPRMGAWLADALPRDRRFDAIVPVPLHWWRQLRRGFNQSELLAAELGRRTGLPVRAGAMKRERATPKQSLLDNAGRQSNVAGAFRVARPAEVAGRRILLLDDVLTTGATLNACAAALKKAGATHVSALTLARVDHRVPATFESAVPAPSGSPNAGATA